MAALVVLLLAYLGLVLIVFPIWVFIKLRENERLDGSAHERLLEIENELRRLRAELKRGAPEAPAAPPAVAPALAPTPAAAHVAPVPTPATRPAAVPSASVPPAPAAAAAEPPPIISPPPRTPPPLEPEPEPAAPAINWEQFMGAKLFAWLGGLALFLGVAFFVKYSFEHDLIPPEVRVALGFLLGTGLIVGGLRLDRERYRITSQTLIAAGVVSLYAVTFACNSIYHFAFFGKIPTFLLMVLITATAFLLAVRLSAQIVAILGMLGGFLTPVLLSTGQDNPPGLFGYLALLDAGLIAVALRTGWRYLVPVSAGGTVVMMIGWADRFLTAEKGPVAMVVCLAFAVVYFVALEFARRREANTAEFTATAAAMPFVGLGFGFAFLAYPGIAERAPLFLGFVLALDVILLALAWREETLPRVHFAAGMAVFALLAAWSMSFVTNDNLLTALAGYLAFAGLHTAFPAVLERRRPASSPAWWSQLFAPLALVLVLLPLFELDSFSWLLWPAVLLIDLIAIAAALASASLAGVAAVMVLTLVVTGVSLFRTPAGMVVDGSLLLVLGAFAVFFFAASLWLGRRLAPRLPEGTEEKLRGVFGDARAQLPAFSSLLPFLLLVLVCARLHVPDPSLVFGLALLLAGLTLGLARLLVIAWLPACALAGTVAVEFAWHSRHFDPATAQPVLLWYSGFYLLFAAYPFAFAARFRGLTGPWAVAALSGVAHFPLLYRLVDASAPGGVNGLLPAAFVLAPLISLIGVLRTRHAEDEAGARLNQLAWFGGATLLFITLIFPVQFSRQWLTIAWALEGAALLWLFQRVPHPGLRLVGVALLLVAFARLALNAEVFSYAPRSATPVFNWFLYTYGTVIAALFVGARLLAPPRERVLGVNVPPILQGLAVVLAFLLLNIEIADYFTPAGTQRLTFQFAGNFARDMTYTIAWALFALGLLAGGIWKQQRLARYAAIGLLSLTLLKLFFHDLARLQALYRIGALFAVAVIAIVASFAYQRFLPAHEKVRVEK